MVATERHPRRRATATSSSPMVRDRLGVEPEVITGDEEAALSFAGATGGLRRGAAAPLPGRRHRRRLDRVRARRPTAGSRRAQHGRRLRADDRAAPARRPADRRRRSRRRRPTSARRSTQRRGRGAAATGGTLVGVAGTVTTIAALALGLERYDAEADPRVRLPVPDVRERLRRPAAAMNRDWRKALPECIPAGST